MKKGIAAALFATTVATILVMWQQAFWVTALAEVAAFGIAGALLVWSLARGKTPRFGPVMMAMTGIAVWPVVQLIAGTTVYRWATTTSLLYWTAAACIVFAALQIFDEPGIRRWYLRRLFLLGFVISIVGPLQLFTAQGKIFWLFDTQFGELALGPFIYTNQYAAFIELVLPVALAGAFSERGNWRIFHALGAAVIYASVFASTSRMGFVICTIEIILVPLVMAKRSGLRFQEIRIPAVSFGCMLLVLGLAVGPERLYVKLQQKDPYASRRIWTESAITMIAARPLTGFGLGTWTSAYPAYAIADDGYLVNQAHDDWAQWTAEGGIPFGLLILSVAVLTVPPALRSGWATGIIGVLIHCFVDYPIQRMGVAVVFFTLIGAAGAYRENRHSAENLHGKA